MSEESDSACGDIEQQQQSDSDKEDTTSESSDPWTALLDRCSDEQYEALKTLYRDWLTFMATADYLKFCATLTTASVTVSLLLVTMIAYANLCMHRRELCLMSNNIVEMCFTQS